FAKSTPIVIGLFMVSSSLVQIGFFHPLSWRIVTPLGWGGDHLIVARKSQESAPMPPIGRYAQRGPRSALAKPDLPTGNSPWYLSGSVAIESDRIIPLPSGALFERRINLTFFSFSNSEHIDKQFI